MLAVLALVAFVAVERRARRAGAAAVAVPQPRSFVVASAIGFVVGFALFGALTYLPLFQQVVRGLSPTASGLQLMPLMAGLLASSIGSGQLISRTGRYKIFPILGTAIAAIGLLLLSRLNPDTGTLEAAAFMLVLGVGLGFVHAGARARGAERRALRAARRRHVVGHAVPLDRRLAGHGDPRRDLLQPAGRRAGLAAAGARRRGRSGWPPRGSTRRR